MYVKCLPTTLFELFHTSCLRYWTVDCQDTHKEMATFACTLGADLEPAK